MTDMEFETALPISNKAVVLRKIEEIRIEPHPPADRSKLEPWEVYVAPKYTVRCLSWIPV